VADPASFALTGTAAGTIAARFVVGDAGSLVLTGVNAGTQAGRTLVGDAGSLTTTGSAAGTVAGRQTVGDPGAFTLNGSDATLTATGSVAYTLVLDPAAFTLQGFAAPLTVGGLDDIRSKGGFDPYVYKRRNKRRAKAQDVQAFVAEVAQADLSDAPPVLVAQAEDALQAAREALALRNAAIEDAATLARALTEINEFYRLVREQVRLRREADDDEDEELLLLH
jgi:hypothetical protein